MKSLLIIILASFMATLSSAQFGKLLKTVEEKVNQNVSEDVDDLFEKKEDPSKKIPPIYTFNYEYEMLIKDKKNPFTMTFFINTQEDVVAMRDIDKDEITIYLQDNKRKKALVYVEGENAKARTSIFYIDMNKIGEKMAKKNSKHTSFTATGKTKDIAGYECQEYRVIDKKTEGLVYITHDADIEDGRLFAFQNAPIPEFVKNATNSNSGVVMGMVSHKKGKPDKKRTEMECTKLERVNFKINNSEYYNAEN